MTVPPHLEREMHKNSKNVAEEFVLLDGFEEGEMGHIVKLDEEPNHIQAMEEPAEVVETEAVDHEERDSYDGETLPDINPGLPVVGLNVLSDVLVQFVIVLLELGISCHQQLQ